MKHSGEVILIAARATMIMMKIFLAIVFMMPSLPDELSSSDEMIKVSNQCHQLVDGPLDHDRLIQCLRTGFRQLSLELQKAREMAITQGNLKAENIN